MSIPGIQVHNTVVKLEEGSLRKQEDSSQWVAMLKEARSTTRPDKARALYVSLVERFPLAVSVP